MKGFSTRMTHELKTLIQNSGYNNDLAVIDESQYNPDSGGDDPSKTSSAAWRGGTIIAQMASFDGEWITFEEYMEEGGQIMDRRCAQCITPNFLVPSTTEVKPTPPDA